ncbi:MAG: MarR family transcriptional regulator [Candidatus Nanopelagicaceae bacterium]
MTLKATAVAGSHIQASETLDAFYGLWSHLIPAEGISRTAGSTLGLLMRTGAMRLTLLAEQEGVSQPAMTGLVHRLEAAGYVSRHDDPSDGRVVLVELTTKGRKVIQSRRTKRAHALAAMLDSLDHGEQEKFSAAMPVMQRLTDFASHCHELQTTQTTGD